MHNTIPTFIALTLSGFFGIAALLNFFAPAFVRDAYARWQLPLRFNRVAGLANLAAAAFLAMPITRLWGVALAGLVTFMAEVMLLHHEKYKYALPGVVVLIALVPAVLAGPV